MTSSFFIYKAIRWLVGGVFLFSGLIKLNELPGFSLKINAYLAGFSTDIGRWFRFLLPYSLPLALAICLVEVGLGSALLVAWHRRWLLIALLLLTCFFTGLTFYTFWFKTMASCGCLGETITLSPQQSFFKNVFLLACLFYLYYYHTVFPFEGLALRACLGWTSMFLFGIALAWYSLYRFPLIDLGPYKVGASLVTLTQPKEPFRYRYWLKKDGIVTTMDTFPADSSYQLIKKEWLNPGAEPTVKNFMIWDDTRNITEEVFVGARLLIGVRQPIPSSAARLGDWLALLNGITQPQAVLWLLPVGFERAFIPFDIPAARIAWIDPDLLRRLLPASMGLLWLEDGVIRGKWPYQSARHIQKHLQQVGLYQEKNHAAIHLPK